ncbi:MAG: tRNA preQ1(34) S-adenosylmethionine ribosyltransferase-isomerase QueA [Spirobacillus cienkowskii]|uniref:tRNA preQ1(34) S-adenosylmethionine ribosyltransferase-isomerase QueA n=1 Tax=Spirobacillus cienkowskii TaxID=495820 RepID=A0A369KTZ5_9BACT|nr:MAG: tRNA preQ1(34) S-adenosylmethionine ribosyltransferase-isomerase QueA [Spirobacillus cienkowskii]
MKKELFNYDLPEELIAQTPLANRDESRLLVCNAKNKSIADCMFKNLDEVLNYEFQLQKNNAKLLLIANNSRVYPARVRIKRSSGGRGEVFFLERGEKTHYSCLLRPQSKLKIGEILYADLKEDIALFEISHLNPPKVSIIANMSLDKILDLYGEMPLPPYIQRDPKKIINYSKLDKERYQTVYSNINHVGSSASPTAGLHFSPSILKKCEENRIELSYVTLHVGLGTFLPVKSEDIESHEMHQEYYFISQETIKKISEYLSNGWPIVFVGTTSLRAVESYFQLLNLELGKNFILNNKNINQLENNLNKFSDKWHTTNIFIHPKNENSIFVPTIGNAIITNFHQPESTLAMLIAALMGMKFWKQFYSYAITNKYRFFSYGDSSLLIFGEQN